MEKFREVFITTIASSFLIIWAILAVFFTAHVYLEYFTDYYNVNPNCISK